MLLVDLKDNGSPGDSQKRGKPGPLGPPGEIMSQPVFVVEGKSYSRASSLLGCSSWCMIILMMVPLNITFSLQLEKVQTQAEKEKESIQKEHDNNMCVHLCSTIIIHSCCHLKIRGQHSLLLQKCNIS